MCSVYYHGMFDILKFKLPDKISYKKDVDFSLDPWSRLQTVMCDSDLLCEEIILNGVKYEKGSLIVIEVKEGGEFLVTGILRMILVRSKDVFMIVSKGLTKKTRLGYYESVEVIDEFSVVRASSLADYKPLILRGTRDKFVFVLHHFISFSYS